MAATKTEQDLGFIEDDIGFAEDDVGFVEEPVAASVPLSKRLEAGIEGFGERATFGLLPRLQAAAGGLIDDGSTYEQRLQQMLARQESLKQQAPKSFTAGQVGGMLAGSAPVAAGLKAIPALAARGALVRGAAGGAVEGALETPKEASKEQGVIPSLQLAERVKSAAAGGAIGGALAPVAGIAKAAGKTLKELPKTLKEASETFALKGAGAMTKELRQEVGRSEAQKLGKKIIEKNLVRAGDTLEDVFERSSKLAKETGEKIGSIYKSAKDKLDSPEFVQKLSPKQQKLVAKTEIDAAALARQIEEKLTAKYASKAGGSAAVNQVSARAAEFAKLGQDPNIKQIHQFRRELDELIDYTKLQKDLPVAEQALKEFRRTISKKVENRVRALSAISGKGLEKAKELKELNKDFGAYAATERMAKNSLGRVQARLPFGLVETGLGGIAGAGSLAAGESKPESLAYALAAALTAKGARKYGSPILSQALRSAVTPSKVPAAVSAIPEYISRMALENPELAGAIAAQTPELNKKRIKALEE